ncbi:hypothetical protein PYCCODRAFT_1431484 [Trametes coccinea BRFM310]|uniref:Uncharacterized protein n=1 Tax=Trametes coccinea (strain BRFM310) TaxID=1353009 RepID=A0A1Y2IZE4_TRAC3|nr:hypothetical protein PYCCODRAFT_1431484 [Trametes coccinea BRFM310]
MDSASSAASSASIPATPSRLNPSDLPRESTHAVNAIPECAIKTAAALSSDARSASPRMLGSVVSKPMKPLGVLMDDLRAIARTATQESALPRTSRRVRPRPRPAIPTSGAFGSATVEGDSNYNLSGLSAKWDEPPNASAALSPDVANLMQERPNALSGNIQGLAGMTGRLRDLERPVRDSPMQGGVEELLASRRLAVTRPDNLDIVSLLQDRHRNILRLPSSPLPGWSALASDPSNMQE